MYLQLKNFRDSTMSIVRNFELMGNKFLLMNLEFDIPIDSKNFERAYYWRLDTQRDLPPMEIGIRKSTGFIKSITLFISDKEFVSDDLNIPLIDKIGLPCFETKLFKDEQFYFDTIGEYNVYYESDKLICLFDEMIPSYIMVLNEYFSFILNQNNELVGFAINKLSKNEVEQLIKSNLI